MTLPGADTSMPDSSFSGVATTPRHVRSRTQSISSDRPSTIGHSLMSPPLSVSPEAAFIAASAASQIVTNDHDSHSETWYDQVGLEPSGDTALVSNGALQLANNFVDQLLFNIIANARSTSLSALRPAVSEVLKPKLAKDAVNQADEELREYLGGGEVEDLVQSPSTKSPRDWDLELVWKRTRLRCMVYSSLGDMEDEDEDYFMEQEHLSGESDDILSEVVSPAVAIFLTSILEFMGEQVLVVAGQAAFNRLRMKYEKDLKDGACFPGDVSDRIVVEELDMERVALDRTLGRLWRAWKKRIRSPVEPSYMRTFSRNHSRQGSSVTDTAAGLLSPKETIREPEESTVGKAAESAQSEPKLDLDPWNVPLPLSNNDVAEIEVPGLVAYSDDEDSDEEDVETGIVVPTRPKSLIFFPIVSQPGLQTHEVSQQGTTTKSSRQRSNSLPTPAAAPYTSSKSSDVQAEPVESVNLADELDPAGEPSELAAAEAAVAVSASDPDPKEEGQLSDVSHESEPKAKSDESLKKDKVSSISKIVAGAAVVGTAAVAGVAAMVQGSAPQTVMTPMEEDEIEEFTEEPQILTTSRVSLGGRSSPATSDSGRPPSLVPVRSNSIRSVRMIEVPGPRSPTTRSRTGSVDIPDYRSVSRSNASRDSSVSTPPIVEERDTGAHFPKSSKRNAVVVPSDASPDVSPGASQQTLTQNTSRATPPPSVSAAGPSSGPTKVTIISTSSSGGSFLDLDPQPEVMQRSTSNLKQAPLPTLPERSASRQVYNPPAPAATASVDRPQVPSRGSPESPKLARPQQHESPSSAASNKFKAMRSSEESAPHRAEDVARNFEELLQNDQTLQYTLTPENMRDIDSARSLHNGSPVIAPKARKSEDVKQIDRSRSSSLKRSVSISKSAGLSSHPPNDLHMNGGLSGPVPRAPPVSMSPKSRANAAQQAREARIPRESIQDFAEFIRSTGPPGERGTPTQNRSMAGGATHVRDINGPVPVTKNSMDGRRPGSVNRARLQARDAAVSASNESSDLIDFIRRGPPSSGNNPRIPRHVAPFRTTMDSDQLQMSGAAGGKAVDARLPDIRNSQASTNFTETSVQSSINSQSALLSQTKKPSQFNNFDDEDMAPKRKQRRVRDPYAIDLSDEEDDDFEMTPKPAPKVNKEESLADFLRNYQPPPESAAPQPFMASQTLPKKKASAPNLIARLRSAGGGSHNSSSSISNRNGFNVTDSRSLSSRASNGKGYTPIVPSVPSVAERYGSNPSSGSPRRSSSTRVQMKKFEPREAVSNNTRTADLAQFLRDSEPPPSAMTTLPRVNEDKSSGFSRMFERRKKSSAY